MIREEAFSVKEEKDGFSRHLGPILFLSTIFFLNFIARIILAPVLPDIATGLQLNYATAGSFFLFISVGYFISLMCSGFLATWLTHKKIIAYSTLALGLALFSISLGQEIWGIRLGLFLLGLAAGPYLPSGIATLTTSASSRHWGKAIAIHELAPNLAFIVAPLAVEMVLLTFSWRAVFIFIGLMAMVMGAIYTRFSGGGEFKGRLPNISAMKAMLSKTTFWIMVVLFSLAISSTLGVFTMLPLYLVTELGFERSWANLLISISRIAGFSIVFVAGWTTDRFGPKQVLTVVFILSGTLTLLLGLAPKSWTALLVILQPMVAVCFFPAGLAALSMITTSGERNLAVSLAIPPAFLVGGGAVPALIGLSGDLGSFAWGISAVGGVILAAALLPRLIVFTNNSDEMRTGT